MDKKKSDRQFRKLALQRTVFFAAEVVDTGVSQYNQNIVCCAVNLITKSTNPFEVAVRIAWT